MNDRARFSKGVQEVCWIKGFYAETGLGNTGCSCTVQGALQTLNFHHKNFLVNEDVNYPSHITHQETEPEALKVVTVRIYTLLCLTPNLSPFYCTYRPDTLEAPPTHLA